MNRLAQLRISWRSIADERSERFSDVETDHQIGDIVLFCRLIVDDDEFCAAVFGHQRKTCGAKLVIINNEPTEQDDVADLVIRFDIGETLGPFVGN